MSKAPETIYISQNCAQHTFKDSASRGDFDVGYVRSDIAYGYACEVERLKEAHANYAAEAEKLCADATEAANAIIELCAQLTSWKSTLTHLSRNASVMTAYQIETMARDALEKK